MYNKYEIIYNYRKIKAFYLSLQFTGFVKLTFEKIDYINWLVEKNRCYFTMDTKNVATLATSAAIKLQDNLEKYQLLNSDEAAYFFIKMVDPEFKFLEAYESIMDL